MKRFWYAVAVIVVIIYSILHLLELLFRTINIFLGKAMDWVDKHITDITENIKECKG